MMLKEIFFLCLRCATGYLLISPFILYAPTLGHIPASTFETPGDPVFVWLFQGMMAVWLLATLVNIAGLFNLWPQMHPPAHALLRWSPIYLPVLYGAGCYLWFFGNQIL